MQNTTQTPDIAIVGAGLAGCECALVLARAGFDVTLFEQKPHFRSPAHVMDGLAELVCSNSLRSDEQTSGVGLLKAEMRALASPFMAVADACRVPADKALAVDRERFSREITARIEAEPRIHLLRQRIESIDDPALAGTLARMRRQLYADLRRDGDPLAGKWNARQLLEGKKLVR